MWFSFFSSLFRNELITYNIMFDCFSYLFKTTNWFRMNIKHVYFPVHLEIKELHQRPRKIQQMRPICWFVDSTRTLERSLQTAWPGSHGILCSVLAVCVFKTVIFTFFARLANNHAGTDHQCLYSAFSCKEFLDERRKFVAAKAPQ